MEVKEMIDQAVSKLKSSPDLMSKFKSDPVKALEEALGVNLPDEKIQPVIDGIKAKISVDSIGDKLGGLFKK